MYDISVNMVHWPLAEKAEMSHHLPRIRAYGRHVDFPEEDGALLKVGSESKLLCSSFKAVLAFLQSAPTL